MRQRTYFVAGGTGKQGGALARQLLAHGQRVRVYTRNPGGSQARLLQRLGADLHAGGFEDPGPLERAMRGCDGAFALATFTERGVEAELRSGRALVDAARHAGVPHLVYSSMAGADKLTGIPHLDSKVRIESYLAHAAVPYTILAPVFFMENWLGILPSAVARGRLAYPLPAGRVLQMVTVDDVAAFARRILEQPTGFESRRVELAGDALPMESIARILSGEARRELPYHPLSLQAIWARDEALGRLCAWLDWEGTRVDIERLRARHREVPFTRFAVWARRQDWDALLAPPAGAGAAGRAWALGVR
jgi:uncharacterized protein YbjT (DUF2867 family)